MEHEVGTDLFLHKHRLEKSINPYMPHGNPFPHMYVDQGSWARAIKPSCRLILMIYVNLQLQGLACCISSRKTQVHFVKLMLIYSIISKELTLNTALA